MYLAGGSIESREVSHLHAATQAANAEATEGAVKVYLLVLRQLLIITHGYECQQVPSLPIPCAFASFPQTHTYQHHCCIFQLAARRKVPQVLMMQMPQCNSPVALGQMSSSMLATLLPWSIPHRTSVLFPKGNASTWYLIAWEWICSRFTITSLLLIQ